MPKRNDSVLSHENQLLLNKEEAGHLPAFREFLERHPNRLGQVLLGKENKPWRASDAINFEHLVGRLVGDEKQMAAFLAIAHNAAHFWSVANSKRVTLPRFHVPDDVGPCPSSCDFAEEAERYRGWSAQLGAWVEELFHVGIEHVSNRELLVLSMIVSSMLHGGTYGTRVLAGMVRAIACHRERSFIVDGRIYVELFLSWGMLAEGETRIWVPDALSACLWTWLQPEDVAGLLQPVSHRERMRPPSDAEIFRRAARLCRTYRQRERGQELGTLFDLRRCCWVLAHSHLNPLLARYADGEISASSPPRRFLRRLFPKGQLVEFSVLETSARAPRPAALEPLAHAPLVSQSTSDAATSSAGDGVESPLLTQSPWVSAVCDAAAAKDPRGALAGLVDRRGPEALLAAFGISLISSTPHSGKRVKHRDLASVLRMLGDSLAVEMGAQDLAEIEAEAAHDIYIRAIKRRPVRQRQLLIKRILELDVFIRARFKMRDPIPLSKLPWPPEDGALDPGVVTHEEYEEILHRIDEFWHATDSSSRRLMMRLVVVLAFRLGLRGGEIRILRLGHLLVRGEPEILLWPFAGDRFKTPNAHRRVPLRPSLSKEELDTLIAWKQARLDQGARRSDRLFAIPDESLLDIPRWLLEDLNDFLRSHSAVGVDEGPVHVHAFRHACQSWIFTSMMLTEAGIGQSSFPDLPTTNEWLAEGRERLKALYGHGRPTAKHAYIQASLAGHGDFFTTARSYVHFFSWVLASFLDVSPAMRPPERLVRLASGAAESTERTWRKRGIHNIAAQLLLRCYRQERVMIPETDSAVLGPKPELSAPEAHWTLLRTHGAGAAIEPDAAMRVFLDRAAEVAGLRLPNGRHRHRMESGPADQRLAVPARPMRQHLPRASEWWDRIAAGPSELMSDGLRIFAGGVDNDGWVRFATEIDQDHATRYIRFLYELGTPVVAKSGIIDTWKMRLGYQGVYLRWMPAKPSRSELLIQPDLRGTAPGTRSALRFVLLLAYIFFRSGDEQARPCPELAELPRLLGS